MFPAKKDKNGNPLGQKWKYTNPNPVEAERLTKELSPLQLVLDKKLEEWTNRQWDLINRESGLSEEQKIARIHAVEFHNSINKQTEFMTNEKRQFVLDFIDWLQYRDPTDADDPRYVRDIEKNLKKLGATCRNGPLEVKGKEEWLTQYVDKKQAYSKEILKLRMGPHNAREWTLHDAWLYYKFILRGQKIPDEGFLDDFDDYFYNKFKTDPLPRGPDGRGGWSKGRGQWGQDGGGGGQQKHDEEFLEGHKGVDHAPFPTQIKAEPIAKDQADDAEQHMEIDKGETALAEGNYADPNVVAAIEAGGKMEEENEKETNKAMLDLIAKYQEENKQFLRDLFEQLRVARQAPVPPPLPSRNETDTRLLTTLSSIQNWIQNINAYAAPPSIPPPSPPSVPAVLPLPSPPPSVPEPPSVPAVLPPPPPPPIVPSVSPPSPLEPSSIVRAIDDIVRKIPPAPDMSGIEAELVSMRGTLADIGETNKDLRNAIANIDRTLGNLPPPPDYRKELADLAGAINNMPKYEDLINGFSDTVNSIVATNKPDFTPLAKAIAEIPKDDQNKLLPELAKIQSIQAANDEKMANFERGLVDELQKLRNEITKPPPQLVLDKDTVGAIGSIVGVQIRDHTVGAVMKAMEDVGPKLVSASNDTAQKLLEKVDELDSQTKKSITQVIQNSMSNEIAKGIGKIQTEMQETQNHLATLEQSLTSAKGETKKAVQELIDTKKSMQAQNQQQKEAMESQLASISNLDKKTTQLFQRVVTQKDVGTVLDKTKAPAEPLPPVVATQLQHVGSAAFFLPEDKQAANTEILTMTQLSEKAKRFKGFVSDAGKAVVSILKSSPFKKRNVGKMMAKQLTKAITGKSVQYPIAKEFTKGLVTQAARTGEPLPASAHLVYSSLVHDKPEVPLPPKKEEEEEDEEEEEQQPDKGSKSLDMTGKSAGEIRDMVTNLLVERGYSRELAMEELKKRGDEEVEHFFRSKHAMRYVNIIAKTLDEKRNVEQTVRQRFNTFMEIIKEVKEQEADTVFNLGVAMNLMHDVLSQKNVDEDTKKEFIQRTKLLSKHAREAIGGGDPETLQLIGQFMRKYDVKNPQTSKANLAAQIEMGLKALDKITSISEETLESMRQTAVAEQVAKTEQPPEAKMDKEKVSMSKEDIAKLLLKGVRGGGKETGILAARFLDLFAVQFSKLESKDDVSLPLKTVLQKMLGKRKAEPEPESEYEERKRPRKT